MRTRPPQQVDMSSSGRIRGFFSRVGHGVKDALKPSDQATTSRTPAPSPGRQTPTSSLLAADNDQLVDEESNQVSAAKRAGAEAWSGLKGTLRLLERSSDAFPPLKSAVAGFLGVVDIFEVSNLTSYVLP